MSGPPPWRLQAMGDNRAVVFVETESEPLQVGHAAPLAASYNDQIRPPLDAIDRLRNLMVMKESTQPPTIVVVGDQPSGKSSILESLAGIELPRGQGICTCVPLIMRLQDIPRANRPELYLEFNGKVVHEDEDNISEAINDANDEIAGSGEGISNASLTLVVKKDGVPDLTMVDLPGTGSTAWPTRINQSHDLARSTFWIGHRSSRGSCTSPSSLAPEAAAVVLLRVDYWSDLLG